MVNYEVVRNRPILCIWCWVIMDVIRKVVSDQGILLLRRQSLLRSWEIRIWLGSLILFRNLKVQPAFFIICSNYVAWIFPLSLILVKESCNFVSGGNLWFLFRRMEYALEVGLAIVIDIVDLLWVLFKSLRWSCRNFLAHVPFLCFLFNLLVLWGIFNISILNC